MMKKQSQDGIAHLGLVLLLVIAAVIGFAGYKVATRQNQVSTTETVSQTAQTIKSKADLETAESTLNQTNLDNDLNPDSLNQDVDNLL